MKVRPGGPWWGGHGFYLQESVPVDVPVTGESISQMGLQSAVCAPVNCEVAIN